MSIESTKIDEKQFEEQRALAVKNMCAAITDAGTAGMLVITYKENGETSAQMFGDFEVLGDMALSVAEELVRESQKEESPIVLLN